VQELLLACEEGEVNEEQKNEVRFHLSGCSTCRKEQELLERSWQALDAFECIEPSANFIPALREKIRKKERQPPIRWFPAWTLAAALLLVLLGAGLLLWHNHYIPLDIVKPEVVPVYSEIGSALDPVNYLDLPQTDLEEMNIGRFEGVFVEDARDKFAQCFE